MASKRSRAAFEADLQAQQSPYVIYGTPLPPLDPDVRDDGSYLPVWKQEVTDDRGRKRLHGAFTGGFSAGYFNTVGSKEGWTPSSFVSTRSNRDKDGHNPQRRPEDFMDEEDLAEAEEKKTLHTADTFAGLASTSSDAPNAQHSMELVTSSGETMGRKLLRKMGWREGQGIGNRKEGERESKGASRPSQSAKSSHVATDGAMISLTQKLDRHGIGYDHDPGLLETHHLALKDSEKASNGDAVLRKTKAGKEQKANGQPRGGFGVGILNDDSDGEDPYTMGPQFSYSRVLGGDKKKKNKAAATKPATNPRLQNKPIFISKRRTEGKGLSAFRRGHDGRLPIDGYVYSVLTESLTSMLQENSQYPRVEIPPGWKTSKVSSSEPAVQSPGDTKPALQMNPRSRAALLGEESLPSKSVFDYLTPAARSRIATVTSNDDLPPARNEAPPPSSRKPSDPHSLIPPLAKEVARVALGRGTGGWMPYVDAPSKRARYISFLEFHAGLSEPDKVLERASGIGNDDWVKEMQEFAHAATIFKPMTGAMASRFTSSTSISGNEGGSQTDVDGQNPDGLLRSGKAKSAAEEAAEVGMYGHLTRSMDKWYPSRLLCKRFNIKPPTHVQMDPEESHGHSKEDTQPVRSTALPQKTLELVGKNDMAQLKTSSGGNVFGEMRSFTSGGVEEDKEAGQDQPRTSPIDINPERNEAIEKERPGEAIFKAIFGSDSEDD